MKNNENVSTTILRNNAGMMRDMWITEDEGYLVLRQTKFDAGGRVETKMIRLAPEEWEILRKMLNSITETDKRWKRNRPEGEQ